MNGPRYNLVLVPDVLKQGSLQFSWLTRISFTYPRTDLDWESLRKGLVPEV